VTLFHHTLEGTTPDGNWSFGLWTTNTGDDVGAALTKFQTAVAAMWATDMDAYISDQVSYTAQKVVSVDPSSGKQIARADGVVTDAGANTGETLPPQIALAVSLRTALATRAGRGRFYLPPFAVDQVLNGRLVSATQTDVLDQVKQMFDSLVGNSHTPVIFHRTLASTTPITTLAVGDVFDTQRRRRDSYQEAYVSDTV
jgi:hypothetical protein